MTLGGKHEKKSRSSPFWGRPEPWIFLLCLWALVCHLWLCAVIGIINPFSRGQCNEPYDPLGSVGQTSNLFVQP